MENIEWAVSKILDCDIEKIRNKVIVKNNKLTKNYILEKQKYVDLLVEGIYYMLLMYYYQSIQ